MAEAERKTERILEFPMEKLDNMNGFAMDFGKLLSLINFHSIRSWNFVEL